MDGRVISETKRTTIHNYCYFKHHERKKGKKKFQGVPQSQTSALPRHKEEEEIDKTKQAQIKQTYEKH